MTRRTLTFGAVLIGIADASGSALADLMFGFARDCDEGLELRRDVQARAADHGWISTQSIKLWRTTPVRD